MYVDILENNLIPSVDMLREEEALIFQRGNTSCHRAKKKSKFRIFWPTFFRHINKSTIPDFVLKSSYGSHSRYIAFIIEIQIEKQSFKKSLYRDSGCDVKVM
ncbi:hypothetical protein BpHYR1_041220, partial [Brachionus plicatilis]